jgi:hypothetical protein
VFRIGGPAGKHGLPDADIWDGVGNATHKIDIGEDLTMLIGSARDGAPPESGVLGLDSDDPVIIHACRYGPSSTGSRNRR